MVFFVIAAIMIIAGVLFLLFGSGDYSLDFADSKSITEFKENQFNIQ